VPCRLPDWEPAAQPGVTAAATNVPTIGESGEISDRGQDRDRRDRVDVRDRHHMRHHRVAQRLGRELAVHDGQLFPWKFLQDSQCRPAALTTAASSLRTGRPQGALAGSAQPRGVPRPQRRDPGVRTEKDAACIHDLLRKTNHNPMTAGTITHTNHQTLLLSRQADIS
jgi:hypothetical protein